MRIISLLLLFITYAGSSGLMAMKRKADGDTDVNTILIRSDPSDSATVKSYDVEELYQYLTDKTAGIITATTHGMDLIKLYYDALQIAKKRNQLAVPSDDEIVVLFLRYITNKYSLSDDELIWLKRWLRFEHLSIMMPKFFPSNYDHLQSEISALAALHAGKPKCWTFRSSASDTKKSDTNIPINHEHIITLGIKNISGLVEYNRISYINGYGFALWDHDKKEKSYLSSHSNLIDILECFAKNNIIILNKMAIPLTRK